MLNFIHIKTQSGLETFSPDSFGKLLGGMAHAQLEGDLALFKDLSIYDEMNKKIIATVVVMLSFETAIFLTYFLKHKNNFPKHWYIPIRNGACEFFLALQAEGTERKVLPENTRIHFETEIDRFSSVISQILNGNIEPNAIGDSVIDGVCHHNKIALRPEDAPHSLVLNMILSSRIASTFEHFDKEFISVDCDISKHDIAFNEG